MLIPEIILYRILKQFQTFTYRDYSSKTDKTTTLLNTIFGIDDNGDKMSMDNFNYYKSAIAFFIKDVESPRLLNINIGYNGKTNGAPCLHILMPTDSQSASFIGDGQETTYDNTTQLITYEKERRFESVYYIVCTSDNSGEVMLMYTWLKAMFMLFDDQLGLAGLNNVSFSGQDLQLQQDYAPPNIFHRNFSLRFNYPASISFQAQQDEVTQIHFAACTNLKADYEEYMKEHY